MSWQQELTRLTSTFQHPAWGESHSRRVYELATELAQGGETLDLDALWAAARIHDAGAFPAYRVEGVGHAERSCQVATELLVAAGFPGERVPLVQEIIRGHMFDAEPGASREAVLFHDADTLDFMGAVGVMRMLSIVGLDDWTPDLPAAVGLIRRFSRELPGRLVTPAAREMGRVRQAEMEAFLAAVAGETDGFVNI